MIISKCEGLLVPKGLDLGFPLVGIIFSSGNFSHKSSSNLSRREGFSPVRKHTDHYQDVYIHKMAEAE